MNVNLANSWSDDSSAQLHLTFYSSQSDDMLFNKGKDIDIICQTDLRGLGLSWSLHHNMINKPFLTGEAKPLIGNKFQIKFPTTDLVPGFYDIRVVLDSGTSNNKKNALDKRPVNGSCTFGWKVNKMAIPDSRPKGFKAFWIKAKKEIDALPLDVTIETELKTYTSKQIDTYNVKHACLPADYDPKGHKYETVESCKVSIAGPDGGRIYGWLAKPMGEGPFPIMLVLPGAGYNPRPRPLEHARHGYLALDIQIHGQDVDQSSYEFLDEFVNDDINNPVKYNYYNIYKRVRQAVNYLVSRTDVDTKKIVVVGGSQGGRLGIVIAGIDSRITAVVSTITHSANFPHQVWVFNCNGVKSPSNPWLIELPEQDGMDLKDAPPIVKTEEAKCFAFFDPMYFAQDIKCPVLMLGGLTDTISPPYSVWAVYTNLKVKKKAIFANPGHAHDWSPTFDRYAWKWLNK